MARDTRPRWNCHLRTQLPRHAHHHTKSNLPTLSSLSRICSHSRFEFEAVIKAHQRTSGKWQAGIRSFCRINSRTIPVIVALSINDPHKTPIRLSNSSHCHKDRMQNPLQESTSRSCTILYRKKKRCMLASSFGYNRRISNIMFDDHASIAWLIPNSPWTI